MPDDIEQQSLSQSPGDEADPSGDHEVGQDENLTATDEGVEEEKREKLRREREARAQALTLEIVGDLPYAEVKPPENVLFVCKLNPVTEGQRYQTLAYQEAHD